MFSITAQAGEKYPRKSWLKIMLPPPVTVGLSTVIATGRGERSIFLFHLQHHFEVTYKSESLFDGHLSLCHPMLFL